MNGTLKRLNPAEFQQLHRTESNQAREVQLERAYQPERAKALLMLAKLTRLVEDHDALTRGKRVWGDVGDMERVTASVQIAIDVLESAF